MRKKAIALLLSPIFKFYLLTSLQERKKNNLYYSLSVQPGESQIKIFKKLKEIDNSLKDADKLLSKKLELEGKLTIQSKLIGAGLFRLETDKDSDWIASYLKISKEEVEKGYEYVKSYLNKGRGSDFLENLK